MVSKLEQSAKELIANMNNNRNKMTLGTTQEQTRRERITNRLDSKLDMKEPVKKDYKQPDWDGIAM